MVEAYMTIFAVVAIVAVGCLSAKAGQFYERHKWERRLLKRAGVELDDADPGSASAIPPSRFDRLEQAVDTIALEMERVTEGQRFVTKLLAERRVDRTPPTPIPAAR
jgi:hypothetical protein